MREGLARIAIAAALGCASGSACAMSAAEPQAEGCRVIGGEKLPAESGGADALCRAIQAAVSEQAPGQGYSVEVRVLGSSRLSAVVTTDDGRKLPEQNFGSMDKVLTSGSFERFATAIATELAKEEAGGS